VKWKSVMLVGGIALAHFVTWVAVFATVFGRVMGSGGSPTGLQSLILSVLGFPLVPRFGEGPGVLALDSLLWGCVLGFAVPRAWHAYKRTHVAA
jgi:hypothetical protein